MLDRPASFSLLVCSLGLLAPVHAQVQVEYLVEDAYTGWELLGISVAVDQDRLLVGAPHVHDFGDIGAAVLYERSASGWVRAGELVPNGVIDSQGYGTSVDLRGGVAIVGMTAPGGPNWTPGPGSALLFERAGATWVNVARVTAPPTVGFTSRFGTSVGLADDVAVVGNPQGGATNSGEVRVYEREGSGWSLAQILTPGDPGVNPDFGASLSIHGSTLVVGAGSNQSGFGPGAAYVFEHGVGGWVETHKLINGTGIAADSMGHSVSTTGDRIAVGIPGDSASALLAGAVKVYARSGANWIVESQLTASNATQYDNLGQGVALLGNRLYAGLTAGAGAIHAFEFDGSSWSEVGILEGTPAGSALGWSVDAEGDTIVSGTPASDFQGTNTGAVYVFWHAEHATPTCFCDGLGPCGNDSELTGCTNSTGEGALLTSYGSPSVSMDELALTISNMGASQFGLVFMGAGQVTLPFGDGLRCVGSGPVHRFGVRQSDTQGRLIEGPGIVAYSTSNFPASAHISAGQTWHFQGWYRDPNGPCGSAFNLSNALSVTFSN